MLWVRVGKRVGALVPIRLFCYTIIVGKSMVAATKKRRGRPATGQDPLVTTRLPKEMVAAIREFAERNNTSRSDAIRQLISAGFSALGAGSGTKTSKKKRGAD
jgi:Ribbon-helix-helix protein, copG family